mmetsp:Transcript_63621/g.165362  ORF Transcript_63621/g.165362 Transcript_63621/m.165362 type:complete len:210 (+) Transcript_63621:386-1015(+)
MQPGARYYELSTTIQANSPWEGIVKRRLEHMEPVLLQQSLDLVSRRHLDVSRRPLVTHAEVERLGATAVVQVVIPYRLREARAVQYSLHAPGRMPGRLVTVEEHHGLGEPVVIIDDVRQIGQGLVAKVRDVHEADLVPPVRVRLVQLLLRLFRKPQAPDWVMEALAAASVAVSLRRRAAVVHVDGRGDVHLLEPAQVVRPGAHDDLHGV